MGELPSTRVKVPLRPFINTGVDFAGPLYHREIYEIFNKKDSKEKVFKYFAEEKINWNFIPQYAPHQESLWEAAVKSAKLHLKRVTKDTNLRFEELETLICQIEAILNSRPITSISADPNDLQPLTPGHFLIGDSLTSYPESSIENIPSNRLTRWKHIEQLRQHFWRRWTHEYLHQCQQRSKWVLIEKPLKVVQIVTLKDDNLPLLAWSLGRIEGLNAGEDGLVRSVLLRTVDGLYTRPITKICLLPIDID